MAKSTPSRESNLRLMSGIAFDATHVELSPTIRYVGPVIRKDEGGSMHNYVREDVMKAERHPEISIRIGEVM
jgi:hypothetical protein